MSSVERHSDGDVVSPYSTVCCVCFCCLPPQLGRWLGGNSYCAAHYKQAVELRVVDDKLRRLAEEPSAAARTGREQAYYSGFLHPEVKEAEAPVYRRRGNLELRGLDGCRPEIVMLTPPPIGAPLGTQPFESRLAKWFFDGARWCLDFRAGNPSGPTVNWEDFRSLASDGQEYLSRVRRSLGT